MSKPLSLLNGISDLLSDTAQPAGLFYVTKRVTHAQFVKLTTIPVEVVPSQGAGKAVIPLLVVLAKNFGVAYGAMAEFDQLFVGYNGASASAVAVIVNAQSPGSMFLNAWLTNNLTLPSIIPAAIASVFAQNDNWGNLVLQAPAFDAGNQPLSLAVQRGDSSEDDLAGGGAANTVDVTTFYFVVPVPA